MSEYIVKTLNVKNEDNPEEVIKQAKAFLGQRSDEYITKFVKEPAYKALGGALRKIGQGDRLNEITKEALGNK